MRLAKEKNMWHKKVEIALAVILLCGLIQAQTSGQSPAISDPQAISLAHQAVAILTNGTVISDVTLVGTATQIAGSWSSTGPATFKALGYGKSRLEFTGSGQYATRTLDVNGHPIAASGKSGGASHVLSSHSVQTDPAWFFPPLTSISKTLQPGIVAKYIDTETRSGISVKHLRFWRQTNASNAAVVVTIQRLSAVDIYLDSTSLLPVALS